MIHYVYAASRVPFRTLLVPTAPIRIERYLSVDENS